jgi:riboflavin kinase/FMN adenylyltransferase
MEVYTSLHEIREVNKPVLTIGNFDGLHRGHAALIARVVEESGKINGTPTALTFFPHPLTVVNPYLKIEQITPLQDKLEIMKAMGIKAALILKFDDEFSKIMPVDFAEEYIVREIGARKVVIGYDFSFGRNKSGTIDIFKSLGEKMGFELIVVPPVMDDGRIISSTRIRSFLKEGHIRDAALFLGRSYIVRGMVVKGKKIGKLIGFPTANLMIKGYLIPRKGVYAAHVVMDDKRYKGVLSIGPAPTFHIEDFSFEVHFLDFEGDIYGREIAVEFVERLRGVEKFKDVEGLKNQIRQDIEKARRIL